MALLLIACALALVVWALAAPLRRGAGAEVQRRGSRRAELEAAKEAKYREIRDAELDWRTGKLSDVDFRQIDRALRAEAVDLLHELDRLDDE